MSRTRKRIVQLMADGIADADITQAIVREVAIPKRLTGEMTESGLAHYHASWTRKVRCIRLKHERTFRLEEPHESSRVG